MVSSPCACRRISSALPPIPLQVCVVHHQQPETAHDVYVTRHPDQRSGGRHDPLQNHRDAPAMRDQRGIDRQPFAGVPAEAGKADFQWRIRPGLGKRRIHVRSGEINPDDAVEK